MASKPRLSKAFTDETFAMVAMAIVTFGVYNLVWAARAIRYVNGLARKKAVLDWPIVLGAIVAGVQGYLITVGVESDNIQFLILMYQFSNLLTFFYVGIFIGIAFQFRSALTAIFQSMGLRRAISPLWTALFGVIYINHVMRDVAVNQRQAANGGDQ